jgi:hypothetical protein
LDRPNNPKMTPNRQTSPGIMGRGPMLCSSFSKSLPLRPLGARSPINPVAGAAATSISQRALDDASVRRKATSRTRGIMNGVSRFWNPMEQQPRRRPLPAVAGGRLTRSRSSCPRCVPFSACPPARVSVPPNPTPGEYSCAVSPYFLRSVNCKEQAEDHIK